MLSLAPVQFLVARSVRRRVKQRHNTLPSVSPISWSEPSGFVRDGFRHQDHSTQTKAALRGLFVDESLLPERAWFLRRAQAFQRCDFILANSSHWHHDRTT